MSKHRVLSYLAFGASAWAFVAVIIAIGCAAPKVAIACFFTSIGLWWVGEIKAADADYFRNRE